MTDTMPPMRLAAILVLTANPACEQYSPPEAEESAPNCGALPKLTVNKAKQDAASAYKRGDHRLIGVYGYTAEVPGIEKPELHVRMIDGTSDGDCAEENRSIYRYAAIYNRVLVSLKAHR